MLEAWHVAAAVLYEITDFFSLPILVRTWLSPWKNDVLTAKNVSLGDQFKIWELNFASRIIGFLVRSMIIFISLIVLSLVAILEAITLGLWLVGPFIPFFFMVLAIWVIGRG